MASKIDMPPFTGAALDAIGEVFFVFTAKGKIVQWNRRVNEVTGYSDEEIAGMHPIELVSVEETDLIRRQIETVLREGHTQLEAHFRTKTGREIPYEFTGALLEHDGEKLICGTGRNIAERKQMEEELARRVRQAEKNNALVQLMKEVASASNEADTFEAALRAGINTVCRQTGWPIGHVYRLADDDTHTLVPTSIWSSEIDDRFAILREVTEETPFAEGEGLPGQVLASGAPVWVVDVTEDANFPRAQVAEDIGVKGAFGFPVLLGGSVVAVLEFFSEKAEVPDEELLEAMASVGTQLGRVAERRQARRILEASEERYRSLTESTVDGIIIAEVSGRIIDWNRGARAIFGYEREEIVGRPIEVIMPERYQEGHQQGMERVRRTGKGRFLGETIELEGRRKGGEEFPIELSLSSWKAGDERYFGAIIRDVTEKRRMQREILRIQEEERRRVGQELHDGIVSELAGITMLSRSLANSLEKGNELATDDLEEMTEMIREATRKARRLSHGLSPVQLGGGNLPNALEQLASTTQKQAEMSCEAHINVEEGLPDLDKDTATHLYRIVQEAVQNAVKHAEACAIEVRLAATEWGLELTVRDDGKGVEEFKDRNSEGVGLHTMRYRADLIGGRLDIRSSPGGGTEVHCSVFRARP